jgi:hypothetical protein
MFAPANTRSAWNSTRNCVMAPSGVEGATLGVRVARTPARAERPRAPRRGLRVARLAARLEPPAWGPRPRRGTPCFCKTRYSVGSLILNRSRIAAFVTPASAYILAISRCSSEVSRRRTPLAAVSVPATCASLRTPFACVVSTDITYWSITVLRDRAIVSRGLTGSPHASHRVTRRIGWPQARCWSTTGPRPRPPDSEPGTGRV